MANNKGISIKSYRVLDLFIFTLLLMLFEYIASIAVNHFDGKYYISIFFGMALIVLMRWGIYGIITIIASSVTYCLANNGDINSYIIYIIGDLFILFNMFWFLCKKEKVKKNIYILLGYIITGFIAVEIGKSIVSIFFGYNFFKCLLAYIGTDIISLFLTFFIVLISRKQNGLFEDQIAYLKRLKKEEETEEPKMEV